MFSILFKSVPYLMFTVSMVGFASQSCAAPFFGIGNSLTADATGFYVGPKQYSIDCNATLQKIYNNPKSSCIEAFDPNFRPWDEAFANETFDYVTVQPFPNSTIGQNVATISDWMNLQPQAQFILHTGWTSAGLRESQYAMTPNANGDFVYSQAYFNSIRDELEAAFPGRVIGSTNIIGILDDIASDIALGTSPIASIEDFYRDPIHFNLTGSYLATNAFYRAMGQDFNSQNFETIPLETRTYLNNQITANVTAVPEPTSLATLAGIALVGVWINRRRKYSNCN